MLKKIISIIFIILFITITPITSYVNIDNNVYADPLALEGLGMMAVATILGSMGVLKFVNQNIGMNEFYQGLIEFADTAKGIIDLPQKLFNIAYTAITLSAKMKISEVKNLIIDYYNYLRSEIIEINEQLILIDDIKNVKFISQKSLFSKNYNDMFINYQMIELSREEIGNGYYLVVSAYKYPTTELIVRASIKYNNSDVYNTQVIFGYSSQANLSSCRLNYKAQMNNDILKITSYLTFYKLNQTLIENSEINISNLEGLINYNIPDINIDIPKVKNTPTSIAIPWDLPLINTEDVIGLTVEQVLEYINNISLETFIDKLLDLPKSVIDSLVQPGLVLDDEGVITGVTETTIPDVIPDIKEQTDVLTGIRDRIDIIIGKIEDFFNPDGSPPGGEDPDKEKIDWKNFGSLFDIFYIFYYLIIIIILMLIKFLAAVANLTNIPANAELFNSYPNMLAGLNYIKNLKIGGFNVTLQQIFEYMFTVFFFIFIVTTLQKMYHHFTNSEKNPSPERNDIRIKDTEMIFKQQDLIDIYERNRLQNEGKHIYQLQDKKYKDEDYYNIHFDGFD